MSLFDAVDIYCERTGIGLLNEPLNALSNGAFFVAAWLLYSHYRTSNIRDRESITLIAFVALVGLGSSLFHTFANHLSQWADVIPIGIFVLYYLWVSLRRLARFSQADTLKAMAAFIAGAVAFSYIPDPYRFNGSISYFPCLIAVLLIAWKLHKMHHPATTLLIRASMWFAVSLIFRSLDMASCLFLPIGTHFLWHMCNGVLLYTLTFAILRQPPALRG